jgi:hypothetical protein
MILAPKIWGQDVCISDIHISADCQLTAGSPHFAQIRRKLIRRDGKWINRC